MLVLVRLDLVVHSAVDLKVHLPLLWHLEHIKEQARTVQRLIYLALS